MQVCHGLLDGYDSARIDLWQPGDLDLPAYTTGLGVRAVRNLRDHAEHGFGDVGCLGDRLRLIRRELIVNGGDGFGARWSSRVRLTTVVVRPRLVVVIVRRPLAARPAVVWRAAAVARRRPLPLGCRLTAVWIRARLSTLARARRSGRLGPLLAAWPLCLGLRFAGVFLPPGFLFLPCASL